MTGFHPTRPSRRSLQISLLATLMLIVALPARASSSDNEILVFAASSLAPPLTQIGIAFESRSGVTLRFAFASSAALARQIEYGAPAHLFITAHPQWLDRLAEKGRVDRVDARAIAGNRLVIAGFRPRFEAGHGDRFGQASTGITKILTLLLANDTDRIATGDPGSVPLGLYARDSLVALGLWEAVSPRLAPAANARSALLQVEQGLVPIGILFASDAAGSDRATILADMPAGSYGPIRYLAVPINDAPGNDAALKFLDFLTSAEAAEIFTGHGFSPPE